MARTIPGLKEIKIPAEELAKLVALTLWYEAMPSGFDDELGDRFHENVRDWQMSTVPDELECAEDGWFVSHFEVRDGVVYAAFDDDSVDSLNMLAASEDPFVYIPYVAE